MYKSSVERTYLDLGCLFCLCSYKITMSETDGLTFGVCVSSPGEKVVERAERRKWCFEI